jgi:hypothetical protein
VTGAGSEHAPFEELAAGHALHALDPRDEQRFLSHLADCSRCQAAVGDYTEVAAALSENWSAAEPGPQLGHRIMAAIASEPQRPAPARSTSPSAAAASPDPAAPPGAPPGGRGEGLVTDLSARRSRHRRPRSRTAAIAGAAAAAVIGAGAVWGGLAASSGGGSGPGGGPAAASCVSAHGCHDVVLTSATTHAPVARVVIRGGVAWLIPSRLAADDPTRQVYVLWQINGARQPLAVGSFDVRGHRNTPVRIGGLGLAWRATSAFAVSLEPGRTIPAKPSRTIALGLVRV